MKKILGIIWMVLVCCLLSSATCWADADVTIQEQVLMDENNICITATELKNTSTSYMLCLQIENNTDEKITVYVARTSINGFMIDGTIAKDVEAHETVNAAIDFLDFLLDDAGISQIGEIETGFHIVGENMDFETAPTTLKTSLYGTFTQNFDDSGGLDAAVENSLKKERMQTELITNVSHDLKTPLTSIINYVDLMKRENPTDPKIQEYLRILDEKSQRLKVLTEDVVEASKASTGNIKLEMNDIDFVEMVQQVIGEFEEKFQEKNLTMMVHFTDEPSIIYADGQRMWRVLENVFGNVVKYAMEGTRVYAEISNRNKKVTFSLKNISAQPLNISADELTERFIRGDVARNTEGSGLGLSIAKSLTELQGGEFKLYLDGDLFKVMITFVAKNYSK